MASSFGENLRRIRTRSGETQEEVAAAVGISYVSLSRYEIGQRMPKMDILSRLADHYKVTVDEILGRESIGNGHGDCILSIGERLKSRRKDLGMSAETVADRLGVSPATVYRYENGDITKIPSSVLMLMSDILKTSLGWLIGQDDTRFTVSERLKQLMADRNLRQVDIIRLCKPFCLENSLQLTKSDLSQFVSGKVAPDRRKLSILSHALGVSESWLLGYDDSAADKDNPVSETIGFCHLTPGEFHLISLYRNATETVRDIAVELLQNHQKQE